VLHHDLEKLDNDLGARPEENLALATALRVGDAVEGSVERADENHALREREREERERGERGKREKVGEHVLPKRCCSSALYRSTQVYTPPR
jgi:hypothetical protein